MVVVGADIDGGKSVGGVRVVVIVVVIDFVVT